MNPTLVNLFVQAKIQTADYQGIIDFILSPPAQQDAILNQFGLDKLNALNKDLATSQSVITSTSALIAEIQAAVKPPQPTVDTPTITPPGGSFPGPIQVTIDDTTPGASIFFTLDGSIPSDLSKPYSGPIALSVDTIVNAIATAPGMTDSAVVTAAFTFQAVPAAQPVI